MLLKRSPVPLYHQLKELLLGKIDSGEWKPGHQLPTEFQLSSEFGLSRATVRQAMQLLESQGLIERMQGRGTFVARPKISHNLLSTYINFADIERMGTTPHVRFCSIGRIKSPPNVTLRLELLGSDEVWELRRLLLADSEPIMLITSWLPCRDFPGLDERNLDSQYMRRVFKENYLIDGGQQHKEFEVTVLDEREANLLNSSLGMPALLVTLLSRTSKGHPYEYRKMVVRGDRSKYHVDLEEPEPLV